MPHDPPHDPSLDGFPVRGASSGDLPALCAIEESAFSCDRLTRRQFLYHLRNPGSVFLVCVAPDGRVAGYILGFLRKGRSARLYSLAVDPAFRGQGVGRFLMESALDSLRRQGQDSVCLEVRAADIQTRAFYERLGFQEIGRLTDYYEDGAEGIKMLKEFSQS